MAITSEHPKTFRAPHPPRNAEQELCSEALESRFYDHMSDKEWITLCEEVAGRERDDISNSEPFLPDTET